MIDLHLKHIVEYGFKVIRSNPDRHLKDIFGDAKLEAHAAIYGNRMIEMVKNWIMKTEIPVVLGFDLNEAKLPAITVHLQGASPATPFLGDIAGYLPEELQSHEKEILVPAFQPASAEWSEDRTHITMSLPAELTFEQKELFLPGLKLRDPAGREYLHSIDCDGNHLISQSEDGAPLDQIDLSKLELVSPVISARYTRGAMQYDETATLCVHGHSNRNEGLWVYYIVMWILLKFRPVLEGTFGMALSFPSASDFAKDESFADNNIWRRYITIQSKTMWSWENSRQKDILGLIMTVFNDRSET